MAPRPHRLRRNFDKKLVSYRAEQIQQQYDENGNRRVRNAPAGYAYVTDDEDDGQFPHRLHREYPNFRRMTPERRDELRQEGFKIREGAFSERESRRVKANFETLMHSPAIADYWSTPDEYSEVVLILTGLFSKVEKPMGLTITDILGERNKKDPLLCPHIHFYVDVCRGLPYRVMAAVRAYLRNSVSDLKPVSQLSEKEIRKVLRLKRKGKRNYEIGYKVRVKPVDVAHLIQSQLTPDLQYISKAPFTLDEDRRLVRKCKRKAGISYLHEWKPRMVQKMDWNQIASQMPGRSVEQCRLRLKIVLLPARYTERMKLIEMKKRLMKKDRIQLIYFLHREEEEGMRSEREIDWAALSVKMKHLPMKEAVYLVSDLKDQVPQDITAFPDRIRWLYDEFLPSFTDLSEEKLKELREWYDEPIGFNQ